jgi:hypothetical protein
MFVTGMLTTSKAVGHDPVRPIHGPGDCPLAQV